MRWGCTWGSEWGTRPCPACRPLVYDHAEPEGQSGRVAVSSDRAVQLVGLFQQQVSQLPRVWYLGSSNASGLPQIDRC